MLRLHRSLGKSFSEPSTLQQAHRDVTQAARLSQSQLQEMRGRALFGARDSKDSSEAQDESSSPDVHVQRRMDIRPCG